MIKPLTADLVSETALQKAADVLKEKHDALRIILFGSKANGKASKDSDIDLCILVKPSSARILDLKRAMRRDIYPIINAPMDILVYKEDTFYDRAGAGVSIEAQINRMGIDL